MKKTKYKCFGKVAVNKTRKEEKKVEELQRKKIEFNEKGKNLGETQDVVDRDLASAIQELNDANFRKEIRSLKAIWSSQQLFLI